MAVSVAEIAELLNKDALLFITMDIFILKLGVLAADSSTWAQLYSSDSITFTNFLCKGLDNWVVRNEKKATIEALSTILEECELISAAESLEKYGPKTNITYECSKEESNVPTSEPVTVNKTAPANSTCQQQGSQEREGSQITAANNDNQSVSNKELNNIQESLNNCIPKEQPVELLTCRAGPEVHFYKNRFCQPTCVYVSGQTIPKPQPSVSAHTTSTAERPKSMPCYKQRTADVETTQQLSTPPEVKRSLSQIRPYDATRSNDLLQNLNPDAEVDNGSHSNMGICDVDNGVKSKLIPIRDVSSFNISFPTHRSGQRVIEKVGTFKQRFICGLIILAALVVSAVLLSTNVETKEIEKEKAPAPAERRVTSSLSVTFSLNTVPTLLQVTEVITEVQKTSRSEDEFIHRKPSPISTTTIRQVPEVNVKCHQDKQPPLEDEIKFGGYHTPDWTQNIINLCDYSEILLVLRMETILKAGTILNRLNCPENVIGIEIFGSIRWQFVLDLLPRLCRVRLLSFVGPNVCIPVVMAEFVTWTTLPITHLYFQNFNASACANLYGSLYNLIQFDTVKFIRFKCVPFETDGVTELQAFIDLCSSVSTIQCVSNDNCVGFNAIKTLVRRKSKYAKC